MIDKINTIAGIVLKNYKPAKGLTIEILNQKNRSKDIVNTRFLIWKLSRQLTEHSSRVIGYEIGRANHATVLHGIKKCEQYNETYNTDKETYQKLLEMCKEALIDKKDYMFERYKSVVSDYISLFEEKQDLQFDFWFADRIGEIALFEGYEFQFSDILFDIRTKQKTGLIMHWYNQSSINSQKINYQSYCMGLKYEHLEKLKSDE